MGGSPQWVSFPGVPRLSKLGILSTTTLHFSIFIESFLTLIVSIRQQQVLAASKDLFMGKASLNP